MTQNPLFFDTTPILSPQQSNRNSKSGRAHSGVHLASYVKPGSHAKATVDPPLVFDLGPYKIPVINYDWRFIGERSDGTTVELVETTNVTWDDSSAVLTGAITFQTPEWAARSGLVEGNHVQAQVSVDEGRHWSPVWRMQLVQPNRDFVGQSMTGNLANDLNRLATSVDTFPFAKGKGHPADYTVQEAIRKICEKYGIFIRSMPIMTTTLKGWHRLIDQHPLDVIHSALLREKNATGIKYAVMMDAYSQLLITPYRRTRTMYQIGPALIGATLSTQLDSRFATDMTVSTDPVYSYSVDKKGHITRTVSSKLGVQITSPTGQQVYGYVHRNVYSPDATTRKKLTDEGKLFMHSIANPIRQWTVTMPGMPFLRRLDAMEIVMPQWGTSQVVWVSDARHTVDGSSGYQTELTLVYDDPYLDNWKLAIQAKLSETAQARNRKLPKQTIKGSSDTSKTTKNAKAHSASSPGLKGTTPIPAPTTVKTAGGGVFT